ncbi:LPFR motif small protein [Streptomyces sp. NPDC002994]
MLSAIADFFRMIGSAIATVVTLPFRLVARLFGGASSTASRGGGRTRRA